MWLHHITRALSLEATLFERHLQNAHDLENSITIITSRKYNVQLGLSSELAC